MSEQKLSERIDAGYVSSFNKAQKERWVDEAAIIEAENATLREQIKRAMEAMGITWGDLEGFGGVVEGIVDTMDDLRKRVERLEKLLDRAADYIERTTSDDLSDLIGLPLAKDTVELLRKEALAALEHLRGDVDE